MCQTASIGIEYTDTEGTVWACTCLRNLKTKDPISPTWECHHLCDLVKTGFLGALVTSSIGKFLF